MNRAAVAALLVLSVLGVLVFLDRRPAFPRGIALEAERGPGHSFALAELTDFDWDRVFLFGPYATLGEIEAALGFHWSSFDSEIESSDRVVLVVFVKEEGIERHFDLARASADLTPCVSAGMVGLTRDEAYFAVGTERALSLRTKETKR